MSKEENKKEEINEIQFDILKVLIDTRKKYQETNLWKKDSLDKKAQ